MDDVDSRKSFDLGEVQTQGFEGCFKLAFGAVGDLVPGFGAEHVKMTLNGILVTPAVDLNVDFPGKLAA
jgi:hypothetical protein